LKAYRREGNEKKDTLGRRRTKRRKHSGRSEDEMK